VRNNKNDTEVEIYGRPLLDNAEPKPTGGEGVRFIADIDGFLDPAQYSPGKRLTVSGALTQTRKRPVGEFQYTYPVVDVQAYHLWPVYQAPTEPLGWRYPYYDPWWPWGPYRHWPYYW
jgi:outer membrane lipoprotein